MSAAPVFPSAPHDSPYQPLPLPYMQQPWPAQSKPQPDTQQHLHLVLPYVVLSDAGCQAMLERTPTPHINALLALLRLKQQDIQGPDTPTPPHERSVAQAWGLDPAAPAWAAAQADAESPNDMPSAWLTPCHFHAGADQVRLDDPAALDLSLEQAQALCTILAPWWQEDGLALQVITPLLWRVSGQPLAQVVSASLDRVLLRDASLWLPKVQPFQRLHSEAQMLLYHHAFTQAREEQGQPPINGFWLHGVGQLSSAQIAHSQQQRQQQALWVADDLRQSALRQHWPAWQQALQAADAGPAAQLLAHARAGGSTSLSLCGDMGSLQFDSQPRPWHQRLLSRLRQPKRLPDYQEWL